MTRIERNICRRDLTTFAIEVSAAALAGWETAGDLAALIADPSLPRPLKLIGGGSNLLFTRRFEGTLLMRCGEPAVERSGLLWTVDANMVLDDLCALVAASGLRGMENLSGIPGTLGGALVQNAGAYGAETGSLLVEAELVDLQSGRMFTVDREWMNYSYRRSRLKDEDGHYAIVRATLGLLPASAPANLDYGNLRAMLDGREPVPAAVREAVIAVRDSKLPDPRRVGSAGSFFRNPEVSADTIAGVEPAMPRYDLGDGRVKLSAAWLIDHAGMKGARVSGAMTWPSQPLVIVNAEGNATAADILGLEHEIISAVSRRFNIILTPEVEHL